jgi:outer membrane protein OmpA-like peptidoglycan-associated protein
MPSTMLYENGKMTKLLVLVIIGATLASCAHPSKEHPDEGPYIRIESPFADADISINGDPVGRTPMDVPYSKLHRKTIRLSAVAVEDAAYRQDLVLEMPPTPEKIVLLAFRAVPAPGASPPAIADCADQQACPDAGVILTPVVFFDTDKSDISERGREDLRTFAEQLKRQPFKLEIVGFADERHSIPYNLQLSMRRAQAVFNMLSELGIAQEKMHVEGRGEIQTIDARGQQMPWSHNRRVEIRIVQ